MVALERTYEHKKQHNFYWNSMIVTEIPEPTTFHLLPPDIQTIQSKSRKLFLAPLLHT